MPTVLSANMNDRNILAETGTDWEFFINPLNAQLNPICHLLTLLGAHHIFYVSRIKVKFDFK